MWLQCKKHEKFLSSCSYWTWSQEKIFLFLFVTGQLWPSNFCQDNTHSRCNVNAFCSKDKDNNVSAYLINKVHICHRDKKQKEIVVKKSILNFAMSNSDKPEKLYTMKFFLNGSELSLNSVNSVNSKNLINQWSMNWDQFKDSLFFPCLPGAEVSYSRDSRFKYGNLFSKILYKFYRICRLCWIYSERNLNKSILPHFAFCKSILRSWLLN